MKRSNCYFLLCLVFLIAALTISSFYARGKLDAKTAKISGGIVFALFLLFFIVDLKRLNVEIAAKVLRQEAMRNRRAIEEFKLYHPKEFRRIVKLDPSIIQLV